MLPVGESIARHIMYLNPGDQFPAIPWHLNLPMPPYVPVPYLTPNTIKMNFFQRLNGAANTLAWILMREFYLFPQIDKVVQKYLPGAMGARAAEEKIELLLVNRHHVIDYNVPSLPFVQEVGGVTLKPAKKLPKDIEEFVNNSGSAGFVVMSFGSLVPDKYIPERVLKAFLEAFSRVPQRVLVKYSLPLKGVPENVRLMDWLPQNDLLGHPKAAAFITHGGHFSLMEAVYHGVPMIGLPVFADQPANVLRAQEKQIGVALSWDLTADTVIQALNTAINDTRCKESIDFYQKLLRDEPMLPVEKAAYWIEHILRHGGRLHLRAEGADQMNFFQYFMLDIIGFVLLVLGVFVYISVKIVKLLCCRSKNGGNKKKGKKQKSS
jgi:glucuronosyltransferase